MMIIFNKANTIKVPALFLKIAKVFFTISKKLTVTVGVLDNGMGGIFVWGVIKGKFDFSPWIGTLLGRLKDCSSIMGL